MVDSCKDRWKKVQKGDSGRDHYQIYNNYYKIPFFAKVYNHKILVCFNL